MIQPSDMAVPSRPPLGVAMGRAMGPRHRPGAVALAAAAGLAAALCTMPGAARAQLDPRDSFSAFDPAGSSSEFTGKDFAGTRFPIGAHLVLCEKPDHEALLTHGEGLGQVIAETADRFRTTREQMPWMHAWAGAWPDGEGPLAGFEAAWLPTTILVGKDGRILAFAPKLDSAGFVALLEQALK